MSALWWRRVASYLLRIVLPASLLSQLVGTIAFGRSSPGGSAQSWIDCASVAVACVISAWSARNGQSWAHPSSSFRYATRIPTCPYPV